MGRLREHLKTCNASIRGSEPKKNLGTSKEHPILMENEVKDQVFVMLFGILQIHFMKMVPNEVKNLISYIF